MEQNNKVGNFGDLLKILLDEKELSMGFNFHHLKVDYKWN